jgi:spore coat polysaccharide biosynthesis protein SpsF (cytidylyltransferase family)
VKYSKKIGLVIQVRSSSVRFKDKFLKKINNLSITKFLISRLKKLKKNYKIIIAIPSNDKKIYNHIKSLKNIVIFKGDKDDVLDRYYKCSVNKNLDTIIRLTGDNPLIDIEILDKSIKKHIKLKKIFTTNCINNTFPNGFEFEIIDKKLLYKTWKNSYKKSDKEHVTPYIYRLINNKKLPKKKVLKIISHDLKYSHLRLTIDKKIDLDVVRKVYYNLNKEKLKINFKNIIYIFKKNKKIFSKNMKEIRDEGYKTSVLNDKKK